MSTLTPCLRLPLAPQQADAYYPADLPEEWRLDYYANEYRALLAAAEWWPSEGFAAQRAELGDDVWLLLERPVGALPVPLTALAPTALVACLTPGAALPDGGEGYPLCLFCAAPPTPTQLAGLATRPEATLCWWAGERLQVAGQGEQLLVVSDAREPRALRGVIEASMAAAGEGRHVWLLLRDAAPATLTTATQLAQMLGY